MFYREDSSKNKFAYVGQAKKLLTRINAHVNFSSKPQHIDLSLKKHGVATKNNLGGYKLRVYKCAESELDAKEKYFIQFYLDHNYNLLNVESGGQDEGHIDLNYRKANKGYRDGLKKGYSNCLKEIRVYFDKYLDFVIKEPRLTKKKKPVAIKQQKYDEFKKLMEGENENA